MSRASIVAASKEAEREVARRYGGRRLHAGEWCGGGDVDVIHPLKAIQVKQRKNVPAYILEGLDQIQAGAKDIKEIGRLLGVSLLNTTQEFGVDPILVIVTKPGSGRPSRMFQVTEVFADER